MTHHHAMDPIVPTSFGFQESLRVYVSTSQRCSAQVVNHTRNRTKPVRAQLVAGSYSCSFAGEKLVLPVTDPSKRFILYICAVTIKTEKDEQGKVFKDISLMGIGFSQPFEVNVCKVQDLAGSSNARDP